MTARARESALRVHLRVVVALLRREMTTRYGRSAGGYFWAVAEPAGMIALLSVVFSTLARVPNLGQSFVVFFATGYLVFNFYRTTAQSLSVALRANRSLLKYPDVTGFDALMARLVLDFLTNCMVAAVILIPAIVFTGERVSPDFGLMAAAVLTATLLAMGIGGMNAVLFELYPTWERVFVIINRPLFIISGVFFTAESMPAPVRDALWFNPLVHVIAVFRQGLYPVYHATVNDIEYPLTLGLVTTFFALLLLRRFSERLSEL
jgi:capsular polysaccharide transport system permease protein